MTDHNRRSTDGLNDEILAAVNEVSSADSRIVLTLLARVHADILLRLDQIYRDEQRIKTIVLNGHTDTHSDDHVWLAKNRAQLEHVMRFGQERAELGGYCDFAAAQIAAKEKGDGSKRRVLEGFVGDLLKIGFVVVLALVAPEIARLL